MCLWKDLENVLYIYIYSTGNPSIVHVRIKSLAQRLNSNGNHKHRTSAKFKDIHGIKA